MAEDVIQESITPRKTPPERSVTPGCGVGVKDHVSLS